jgi:hypothetical protein
MIKNQTYVNREVPQAAGKVLSFTAKIDLTQVRQEQDLIVRETKQYEVCLTKGELPLSINFDGRTYTLNLTTILK